METYMKEINLDSREKDKNFISYLKTMASKNGYELKVVMLEFGDLNFENIYIERKTPSDFCSSVCSDRLWSQVRKMKENSDYSSLIVISGTWDSLRKEDLKKIPQLEGAINQLHAWGIPVIRVKNDEELVDFALKIFDYSKPIDSPIKKVKKIDGKSIVRSFPGVGKKSMDYIKTKFDTVLDFLSFVTYATEKDIQSTFGKAKGTRIFNALKEKL